MKKSDRKTDAVGVPAPPEGQGPVLAWFKFSWRRAVNGTIWVLVAMVIGVSLLQGFSIAWMGYWQPWLVLFIVAALFYGVQRRTQVTAGSEWLQQGSKWVRTYELARATAHPRIASVRLHLVDRSGRRIRISEHNLQEDPRVWNLVHKGIVHSVLAEGAKTNGLLHRAFDIPRPGPGSNSSRGN